MPPRSQYLGHGVRTAHPTHSAKTTTTRRRSNGAHSTDPGPLADPVPIEDFPPPEWRTVLNSRADLGELGSGARLASSTARSDSADHRPQDTPTSTRPDQAMASPRMSCPSRSSRTASPQRPQSTRRYVARTQSEPELEPEPELELGGLAPKDGQMDGRIGDLCL